MEDGCSNAREESEEDRDGQEEGLVLEPVHTAEPTHGYALVSIAYTHDNADESVAAAADPVESTSTNV